MRYFPVIKTLGIALFVGNLFSFSVAAEDTIHSDTLTHGETKLVVSAVAELLDRNYIFPETSNEIRQLIHKKLTLGQYNKFVNGQELAQQLTQDLQAVSKDRHLRVYFDPKRVEEIRLNEAKDVEPDSDEQEQQLRRSKNFGFKEVSILNGNIGYIDLRRFDFPDTAAAPLAAAMKFLENTDAFIFDVRKNGGGYPATVQLIVSYLLKPEPVHLNNIYKRKENLTRQYWSLPSVEGKRRSDVDVYVLTSRSTFSAAEDFSYTLKHLERATIVGETTGGGAHPGGVEVATDRFLVWTPTARSINPVTGTNWEGSGVIPHVDVAAKEALNKAHILALEKLIEDDKGMTDVNQWYLTSLKATSEPYHVAEELLQSYQGSYGVRTLLFENGDLYYQRKGNSKRKLTPINEQLFMVEGYDDFRIKVIVEGEEAIAIQGISDDGSYSQNAKNSM